MIQRHVVTGSVLALFLTGCSPSVDVEAERNALMEADRAFYTATAERGVEGWLEFFADGGRQIVAGTVIEGEGAIRKLMTPAFTPGASLRWTPSFAEVGAGGDLGYTIGAYDSETTTRDGDVVTGRGIYVTIWRKQTDGSWKVVLDIGSEGAESPGGE